MVNKTKIQILSLSWMFKKSWTVQILANMNPE